MESITAQSAMPTLSHRAENLINLAIGILLKTQWLFTVFLRETKNRRISFITIPGQKSPNEQIQRTTKSNTL